MNILTKGDLVLAALRKIAVASNSTLTDVEPQSIEDAANDLEMMMAEWLQEDTGISGIDVGYLFSADGEPVDPGDAHGLKKAHIAAVINNLAIRHAPDYAIEAMPKVVTSAAHGKELLQKATAIATAAAAKSTQGYPSRMPVGSGNRLFTRNGVNFFPKPQ
ncbi:packaged DNA stabilization gp4 family protein [Serratia sp. UGAL515B_01]|uniref:packaged DNA stabilization gp4 family protein n=1 Tax=Serratia sp. UGAL515B_01 TaxID=2986763 RepID=UPI0029550B9F|nr:packaged DNA stabilization gp4 family protein [Serratia sp. UGAL515B_01]WON77579.1 packaged DNA stabilization gp4 family protein [Serratia sp. UGAL515B_01]